MSKKDILERLVRAPESGPRVIRREPELESAAAARALPPGDQVTTRVAGGVVRRRPANEVPVEAPKVVVRRKAVELDPIERPVVIDAAQVAAPPAAVERTTAPKEVEAPAVMPRETAPAATVEAAPPAAQPTPRPAEARAAAPEATAAANTGEAPRAEPVAARPADPVRAVPPLAPTPPPSGRPTEPRYAGLGRAVVQPPPGYDPTNPMAGRPPPGPPRRRVEQAAPVYPAAGQDRRGPRRTHRMPDAELALLQRSGRGRPRRKVAGPPGKGSPAPKASKRKVRVDGVISVGQLAHELGVKAPQIIRQLMGLGRMATINEMLDVDTASIVCAEFEYEVENVGFTETEYLQHVGDAAEEDGQGNRPPVVAIMGHVDHGKTTLLDAIRKARVAAGESGGITQHIGAYQVEINDQKITFLDTPGHEAFSAMRARGASITDIVVLVVAADDGVQPQTLEAIHHAKAAGVPIVVAVNKMDKPGANPDAIKQRLAEHDLNPEEWGGDTMYAAVSALKQTGLDGLLETILLQAEVLELRANADRHAEGMVIEAKMERGRGAVATVLVQKGTLKRGDHVVLGSAFGRVRAMLDHHGKPLEEAGPSTPVELFGLSDLPEVGDSLAVVANEKNARTLAEHRAESKRAAAMAHHRRRTAEDIYAHASEAARKTQYLILKADVGGTLQAIKAAVEKIEVDGTEIRILHHAVGDISESDVNLAASNGALLLGFKVAVDARARQSASEQGVEPVIYEVIYELLDQIERRLKGLLDPTYTFVRQGTVEVRVLFRIGKVGVVAGCYVQDGKVARSHTVKVVRNGKTMWEGRVDSVKRFKEDVREVGTGFECGVALDGFDEIEVGDTLETYAREQVTVE